MNAFYIRVRWAAAAILSFKMAVHSTISPLREQLGLSGEVTAWRAFKGILWSVGIGARKCNCFTRSHSVYVVMWYKAEDFCTNYEINPNVTGNHRSWFFGRCIFSIIFRITKVVEVSWIYAVCINSCFNGNVRKWSKIPECSRMTNCYFLNGERWETELNLCISY